MTMEDHGEVERWEECATARDWREYDFAAEWCARRGLRGVVGDALPPMLSVAVVALIADDLSAFETRVRQTAYAMARG